jgi:hypothetical protein
MKAAAFLEEVLQLRIQIRGIEPPIFRVIQVTSTRTFHLLHEIIQWSFGWNHAHLYAFAVGRTKVAEPVPEFDEPPFPSHPRTTRLGDLVPKDVTHFSYTYDLGDDWLHDIAVEKRFPPDPAVKYPVCLEGARAAPLEDCGGAPGYQDFLEAWRDPKHEEHEHMRTWAGPRYDPERFDLKQANEILKMFRSQAPKKK